VALEGGETVRHQRREGGRLAAFMRKYKEELSDAASNEQQGTYWKALG
jgi:hypothetical protein